MALLKTAEPRQYSRILGYGAFRPAGLVDNARICEWIESSDEWIRTRTGIVTRRRASAEETLLDMAAAAAREAVRAAGLEPSDVDAMLLASMTNPDLGPSLAARVAHEIGASPAAAFDLSAACAGFAYGIGQADALVRAGTSRNVLVIGAERMSDIIDDHERTISFIMADGAGAAVVGPSEEPGIGPTVWGSDGAKAGAISMTHSFLELRGRDWLRHPVVEGEKIWPTLRQDGPSVFRWAVWQMAKVAQEALDAAGITAEELGAFVPHQANMRIIDQMAKTLRLPESVLIARDIAETGNTSAASIPLAAHRLLAEHPEAAGRPALQIGFGSGLAYAAQVVLLPGA